MLGIVKAELVAALKEAVAYCSKTYAGMTDAKGSEMMKLMNLDFAKLTALSANTARMTTNTTGIWPRTCD
ncbi:MAG: hypothetical protein ACJ746_17495 [Bryobacteraceae bacterium]